MARDMMDKSKENYDMEQVSINMLTKMSTSVNGKMIFSMERDATSFPLERDTRAILGMEKRKDKASISTQMEIIIKDNGFRIQNTEQATILIYLQTKNMKVYYITINNDKIFSLNLIENSFIF